MERLTYIIVLTLYLLCLAAIGIVTSRRIRSAADYAIGSRSIGPWVTAMSFVAAYFSSVVIIGGGGFGYRYGMATIWIGASNVLIGCTLAWMILGKRIRRMTEDLGTMTISEFIGKRYNSQASLIFSAAIISLFLVVYNVSVIKGMANAMEVLLAIDYWKAVLVCGLIIIFYVAIGGYLAVVWTSFVQAWVMIISLLLLSGVTIHRAGGFSTAISKLESIDTGYVSTPGVWGWAGLISYCLVVSLATWGMPQLVIRFYSIKDPKVLRSGIVVVTLAGTIALLPYLTGAISRIYNPNLANPDLAIPTLTRMLLPPLGGAVFLAGVVAAGMSTFAGVLIIISSSVVRDLIRNATNRAITQSREIKINRIVGIAAGLASMLIALRPPSLILVLTAFAWAVIASTNLWPLLFGIYWNRTSPLGTLASMITGATMAILWHILGNPFGLHGFIAGAISSLIVIVLATLLKTRKPDRY